MLSFSNQIFDSELPMEVGRDDIPAMRLVKRRERFESGQDLRLRNDLLLIIGYLEFFNALDFPANIWQEIPVPTFAVGLMATGGSIALIASTFAWIDFRRSFRNIRLLRAERQYLLEKHDAFPEFAPERQHVQAWLSLNFRELGWELIDRSLQDILVGFASILVGVGTLMAIGGANHRVFIASNLLSGYIGNGFVALFGLLNAAWSVYLYVRAQRHKRLAKGFFVEKDIRLRAIWVFRNHQTYAFVNGMTVLVSSTGSLISSTMWWGYVILIPCIFSSIFCNVFWRKRVGYNRVLAQFRGSDAYRFDINQHIASTIQYERIMRDSKIEEKLKLMTIPQLLNFGSDHEFLDDIFALVATNRTLLPPPLASNTIGSMTVNVKSLAMLDVKQVLTSVKEAFLLQGARRMVDRERMLFELFGAYLHILGQDKQESIEAEKATTDREFQAQSDNPGKSTTAKRKQAHRGTKTLHQMSDEKSSVQASG